MSSAVRTRCTPANACAGATSMRLIRPCATVLRTILPYSMPGRRRLCTYSARPVTFSHDSSRGSERPTCAVSVGCAARFIDGPLEIDADELLLVGGGAVLVAFDLHFFRSGFGGAAQRLRVVDFSVQLLFGSHKAGGPVGGCA